MLKKYREFARVVSNRAVAVLKALDRDFRVKMQTPEDFPTGSAAFVHIKTDIFIGDELLCQIVIRPIVSEIIQEYYPVFALEIVKEALTAWSKRTIEILKVAKSLTADLEECYESLNPV